MLIEHRIGKSEISEYLCLQVISAVSIVVSEVALDLVRLFPLFIIPLDLGESVHFGCDIWEYHEHLSSESIVHILPEEILGEVSHLESRRFLDRPLVFSLSTDDHLQECGLAGSIFADEGYLVPTVDLHLSICE